MRVYHHQIDDGPWVPLTGRSNAELLSAIRACGTPEMEDCPSSPNGPVSDDDFIEQCRIILFAREMGWL